jgi:hypothetical protein
MGVAGVNISYKFLFCYANAILWQSHKIFLIKKKLVKIKRNFAHPSIALAIKQPPLFKRAPPFLKRGVGLWLCHKTAGILG